MIAAAVWLVPAEAHAHGAHVAYVLGGFLIQLIGTVVLFTPNAAHETKVGWAAAYWVTCFLIPFLTSFLSDTFDDPFQVIGFMYLVTTITFPVVGVLAMRAEGRGD